MPPLHLVVLARIPLVREGLRALLSNAPDFRVTPIAPSDEILDDLLAQEPDVLLLDVQVLELEGWGLLNELRRELPQLTTLIVGDNANDLRVARALELGARGYLLRDTAAQEMTDAIRAAHSGTITLHPLLVIRLLETLRANGESDQDEEPALDELIEPLSERELDVLRLMARGMPNKQIAGELYITEHTVKFHIRSILGKLGAANRTEAVTLGLQRGLISL